jgi:hypothetical protein
VNIYQRNTPINLVQRFWNIDPLTQVATLADPTTVVYSIRNQNWDDPVSYVYGVDLNVTKISVGVYICTLTPPLPIGIYHYICIGTGEVEAQSEDDFEITDSAVQDPEPPNAPVQGPAYPWITGQDVAACTLVDYDQQPWVFDTVAAEASMALYEISGRQFPGIQSRVVRPCTNQCSCWVGGPSSYGFGPFWWTGTPFGFGGGWWWWNESSGARFGCAPMSTVRLAGYPVFRIEEVLINGVPIPEFDPDTGARNWRLDKWRYLVRMNAPGNPSEPRFWPGCQDMSLDADQCATFQVTYLWGTDVPQLGRQAAIEVANQLYLACGGQQCQLPVGVQKVTRQGIEIERGLLANWMDPTKPTGLINLDTFLAAYWYGGRSGRRSAIWSPDLQEFARRVGTGN